MQNNFKKKILATVALSATLTIPSIVAAQVSGPCGSCHTMHNSQNGQAMVGTAFGLSDGSLTDTKGSLLRYNCVGCHTGTNSGGNVPFVMDTGAVYGTNTLAGGNFSWVDADQTTGHNVVGITGVDTNLPTAPGGTQTAQVTCAGTMGCHGDGSADQFNSISGGHHGNGGTTATDPTKTYVSGSTSDMSDAYRMLAGVTGIEDNDWEYTTGTNDHNLYFGVGRTSETELTNNTISNLCAKCHGTFHTGSGNVTGNASSFGSPWVRHPTDFDMGNLATTSEYSGYTSYSVDAPVASNNISAGNTVIDDTLAIGGNGGGTGDAIVTCVSCHRAHGSPYSDLLRWSYTTLDAHNASAAGAGTACFICHTTKDQ
jgi:hypothetical protein